MALGALGIITAIILLAALASLLAVALKNGELIKNNRIFTLIGVVVIIISTIVFTSYPSNYILKKCIAVVWILFAIAARFIKVMDKLPLARVLLSISIIGATAQYLFI